MTNKEMFIECLKKHSVNDGCISPVSVFMFDIDPWGWSYEKLENYASSYVNEHCSCTCGLTSFGNWLYSETLEAIQEYCQLRK